MKDLLTFLSACLLIFCIFCKEKSFAIENSIPENSLLNGTVSVYYDLNGKPYIYIEGYTKKDGTFINGYYRSLPNKDKSDNWSTKGNINPFTGKKGYEKP